MSIHGWLARIKLVVWRTNEDETPVKRYSEKLHAVSELRVVILLLIFRGGSYGGWGWRKRYFWERDSLAWGEATERRRSFGEESFFGR